MHAFERPDLAPYAAKSSQSRGRRYPEDFKDERPAFERDRDRIIHSSAFRRLEYKTQVFVNHEGDYYRTRLTHTLEVAQIAKGIARRLMLNEELTESIALAHDLGHTPFGHSGERALNRMMKDKGGFEHNLQSLRVVEVLEDKYPDFRGLNLTWEAREGLVKHGDRGHSYAGDPGEYAPGSLPTLEAQIIPVADEIAYNNHDIDDALEAGFITFDQLRTVELCRHTIERVEKKYPGIPEDKKKHQTISTLIGYLINDVVSCSAGMIKQYGLASTDDVRKAPAFTISYSAAASEQSQALKHFLDEHVYRHYKVERMRIKAERYISILFETYRDNPSLLPGKYYAMIDKEAECERVLCDYIAGMTDRYALDEYKKLFEPYERV